MRLNPKPKGLFEEEGWERGCGSDKWTVKRWKENLIFLFYFILYNNNNNKIVFSFGHLRRISASEGSVKTPGHSFDLPAKQILVPLHLTGLIISSVFLLEGLPEPKILEPGAGMKKIRGTRYVVVTEKRGPAFWKG